MPDTKITALAAITTVDPAADVLPIVDISDTSMAASGTTKKITSNQILGAGGTATLASATITGDLTVATDRLKVNTGSTAVQIGSTTQTQFGTTAWPSDLISKASSRVLIGNLGTTLLWNESSPAIGNASTLYIGAKTGAGATTFGGGYISAGTENASDRAGFFALSTFQSNGIDRERYRIDSTGVHTWQYVGGVAGTAMTLNSTGLGVGTSPSYKIHALSTSPDVARFERSGAGGAARIQLVNGSGTVWYFRNAVNDLVFNYEGTDLVTFGSSGNVGIGVAPSAWFSTWKVLQLGGGSFGGPSDRLFTLQNAIVNPGGDFQYVSGSSTPASGYRQFNGAHDWYTAAAGTSPNTITDFSSPKMTLDASGNLILQPPSSPPTLGTNGQLAVNATSNTNLRFSYRGSDGVTRVANITLA